MSEELRELAHAIVALAESNQGIGGVLREVVATNRVAASAAEETNRILGLIFDQNATIAAEMHAMNGRHNDSERKIRMLESTVKRHGERFVPIEEALGISTHAE